MTQVTGLVPTHRCESSLCSHRCLPIPQNTLKVRTFCVMDTTRNEPQINTCKPLANVTNGSEAYPKRWIAVLVQSNCEKTSATKLNKLGYETWIPVKTEIHKWSDRKKKIDRLILPMVLFVRISPNEENWLRNQKFILKLLALPGSIEAKRNFASSIPDQQLEDFRFMLAHSEDEVTIETELEVGMKVKLKSGPFAGATGHICKIKKNKKIVLGIPIGCLGYACTFVRLGEFEVVC